MHEKVSRSQECLPLRLLVPLKTINNKLLEILRFQNIVFLFIYLVQSFFDLRYSPIYQHGNERPIPFFSTL